MSSKKAMKLAQKQAYAKHRSNITNSSFAAKKTNFKCGLGLSVLHEYPSKWNPSFALVMTLILIA